MSGLHVLHLPSEVVPLPGAGNPAVADLELLCFCSAVGSFLMKVSTSYRLWVDFPDGRQEARIGPLTELFSGNRDAPRQEAT